MSKMAAMVKTTQESQFKGEMRMNKLQESVKMHDKTAVLEKQIGRQELYSRRNCILLHGIPECKCEDTDDDAVKTICENINDNIITVDNIDRSHSIGKYDPQKKKSNTCDCKIRSI